MRRWTSLARARARPPRLGGYLRVLQSHTLQELAHLRSVELREVLEYGCCCSHVLARTGEDWDRRAIRHDAAVDVSRLGTGPPSALAARELALEHLVLLLELPLCLGNF